MCHSQGGRITFHCIPWQSSGRLCGHIIQVDDSNGEENIGLILYADNTVFFFIWEAFFFNRDHSHGNFL